ncbi:MAG TPA: hypothetical protein VMP03_03165 [Methylomirabilota bacterium]|nr:hypothetical protein [Methylomirabilota bacterium]
MFKHVPIPAVAVIALLFAAASPSLAEEDSLKTSIIQNQAQVRAFVHFCDSLTLKTDLVAETLNLFGFSFDDADQAEMDRIADALAERLSRYDRKVLCLAGELMYGPDGLKTADMVNVR